jgi:hypothetical protein
MIEPSELSQRIEEDKALATSRKYVLVVSLILLGLLFSGAKVTEANTFILKLTFTNSEGIFNLLLLSLVYLVIRYHSNAAKYHKEIHKDWTGRLLNQRFFYNVCEQSDDQNGYIVDIAPEYAGYNDESFRHEEHVNLEVKFKSNWFLNSQIQYDLHNAHAQVQDEKVYIFQLRLFGKSLKALWLVFKCWFDAQIRYRESLEIYAPYLIFFITVFSSIMSNLF